MPQNWRRWCSVAGVARVAVPSAHMCRDRVRPFPWRCSGVSMVGFVDEINGAVFDIGVVAVGMGVVVEGVA